MNFRFKYRLKNLNNIINFLIFTLFIAILLSCVNINLKKNKDIYYLLNLIMLMVSKKVHLLIYEGLK